MSFFSNNRNREKRSIHAVIRNTFFVTADCDALCSLIHRLAPAFMRVPLWKAQPKPRPERTS